jgi:FtsZ-interacting cell division protein YlmF
VQQLSPEAAVTHGVALAGDGREFFESEELTTFWPKSVTDAREIAEALRTGKNVAVDLAQAPAADALRIRDFVDGATRVRGGTVERVSEMKFRVMPAVGNEREWAISATRGTLADLAPRAMPSDGVGT